ncbi:magnesium transporter CorA family protein [Cryptosporangium phraense]|uniref:Magnesium transporter CorA family protein n=1 Tax=Cryptosporangium phraense TaxID=2593070 RepID=A0A545AMX3_9ACTN|nr:magnesium transporter CorA family protein [Cryptosporangium phraense]TQS42687.1 magnesium transporter CorA family protein [Cryptosporangium phraense]
MDVRVFRETGVESADDLPKALAGNDLVWVDVPPGDAEGARVLEEVFGFHHQAIEDAARRNPAPKLHVYSDHVFLVLHAPELGAGGHVHYIELDVFLGPKYLVTVHGPLNPAVSPELALVETGPLLEKVDAGRWTPTSSYDIAHAVITALNRRMAHHVSTLTTDTWQLEREVTGGAMHGNPEPFLDEMFRVRHGLQAVQTMASLDRQLFGRLERLRVLSDEGQLLVGDASDQFGRITAMAEAQSDYLQGVIALYQTRTNTKMTVAAERLAVIAAVTLPVTAISSVLGMNIIVNEATSWPALVVVLTAMALLSGWLLIWTKRQGWW